jgi:hypothetical protein
MFLGGMGFFFTANKNLQKMICVQWYTHTYILVVERVVEVRKEKRASDIVSWRKYVWCWRRWLVELVKKVCMYKEKGSSEGKVFVGGGGSGIYSCRSKRGWFTCHVNSIKISIIFYEVGKSRKM